MKNPNGCGLPFHWGSLLLLSMDISELYERAKSLPLEPGVYIMYNRAGNIIYIGKAKKLRNRVSQYFTNLEAHQYKVYKMVTNVDRFEFILTASELEALILECRLIKEHKPKYNILLKDDKGYPYVALSGDMAYPRLSLAPKKLKDSSRYFGPFGGRYLTQTLIDTLNQALGLPVCSLHLPLSRPNARPCLNYHLHNCDGWCCNPNASEYADRVESVKMILTGRYSELSSSIKYEMEKAAEALNFELAAKLRDRLRALDSLREKQLVSTSKKLDIDAAGFAHNEKETCFVILHYINGTLLDKELQLLNTTDTVGTFAELIIQNYSSIDYFPEKLLLPPDTPDLDLIRDYFQQSDIKTEVVTPQKGDLRRFLDIATKNAEEELSLHSGSLSRTTAVDLLCKQLGLPTLNRMEAFDISHLAGTDIVASMVVCENGHMSHRAYRHFKLRSMDQQDDYAAMRQVLQRRLTHLIAGDSGFEKKPDLLLIDGGAEHAAVAEEVLAELKLSIPVYGMVKDDRHRTRALIQADGYEISIASTPVVFSLIGTIQEECHRFAIEYQRKLRSKRMVSSELDSIPGIGPKRREDLLRYFGSADAVKNADYAALCIVLPKNAAIDVYNHYHGENAT